MDPLQLREKEIFETLKKIKRYDFVLIGGYAVTAYTIPRFSVDCDIVVKNNADAHRITRVLTKAGYSEAEDTKKFSYSGTFTRYEKQVYKNFRVSVDILITAVFDRQTSCKFTADWVFSNSSVREVKGKTITEVLKVRIVDRDALIVMKFACGRLSDIRDVFMLLPLAKDTEWIKHEVAQRYDFDKAFKKIKDKVLSAQFKNDLQGVFGYIDPNIFEKHRKAVVELGE